jgi:hypothetical protein
MKRKKPAQPAVSQRAGLWRFVKRGLASGLADLGDLDGYALQFPSPIDPSEALEALSTAAASCPLRSILPSLRASITPRRSQ